MKRVIFIIISISLLFAGCSTQDDLSCGNHNDGETWKEDCNTCSCDRGNIICTEIACEPLTDESQNSNQNQNPIDGFKETLNLWKFNSNLTDYEKQYLTYYENKYPNSKIYFIKTEIYKCEGCYDIYYKKDWTMLLIKIRDGKILQENIINSNLEVEIENEDVCKLYLGTWNECPKLCPTDEEICVTQCGEPICEFDENKLILKKEGEICGGLKEGDCEYGLTCSYKSQSDEFGVCVK